MAKQNLKERFQQLAGIKPLYEQETEKWGRWNLDTSTQAGKDIKKQSDSIPTVSSSEPGRVTKDKWEFFDLKFSWMTELPEDIKVTVPDLYGPSVGEPTQKVNTKFPPGATNIGYTLQGWFDEFEKKYPEALFYVDEQNNTVEVADTREEGINLKWFEDVEASESKRVDNSPKPGSWRKSDNMGNLTDPWS